MIKEIKISVTVKPGSPFQGRFALDTLHIMLRGFESYFLTTHKNNKVEINVETKEQA